VPSGDFLKEALTTKMSVSRDARELPTSPVYHRIPDIS